jgi:hypothetical protein
VNHASRYVAVRLALCAAALTHLAHSIAQAQPPGADYGQSYGEPVYQRHSSNWNNKRGHHGRRDRGPVWMTPQVNSGWFQRPYPYHLDYYKMRYGGSYAPYFGNLYGTPQVVTAPPYYGPYYGNFEAGGAGGYPPNGAYPSGPNGMVLEPPIEEGVPQMQGSPPPGNLPAP